MTPVEGLPSEGGPTGGVRIEGIKVEGVTHSGAGVGRHDGKTVFIEGALPGDVVAVEVVGSSRRFDRAVVRSLLEASPERIPAPCAHADRCGGCPWQSATYPAQLAWKGAIVSGQLQHVGRLDAPVDPVLAVGDAFGYRNRIDLAVTGGRPAFHARASSDLVAVDSCLVAAPRLASVVELLDGLGEVTRITLRAGVNTGDAVAIVDGVPPVGAESRWGVPVSDIRSARLHEEVGGRRFRISGRAFFQVNTPGAEALVRVVEAAAGIGPDDVLLDGYAGGGLFSATVGSAARRVVAVESDRAALSDLAANTGENVEIVAAPMERPVRHPRWDVAVVDPPRAGMGRSGVATVLGGSPRVIVSVSCDPATFARDARLLVDSGYRLHRVWPVDLFPQTPHIETVALFSRE